MSKVKIISDNKKLYVISIIIIIAVLIINTYFFGDSYRKILILPFKSQIDNTFNNKISNSIYRTMSVFLTHTKYFNILSFKNFDEYVSSMKLSFKEDKDSIIKDCVKIGNKLSAKYVVYGQYKIEEDNLYILILFIDVEEKEINQELSFKVNTTLDKLEFVQEGIAVTLLSYVDKKTAQLIQNDKSYNLYVKGLNSYLKATLNSYYDAIAFFKQSIENNSNMALSYSGLGKTYSRLARRLKSNQVKSGIIANSSNSNIDGENDSKVEEYITLAFSYSYKVTKEYPNLSDGYVSLALAYREFNNQEKCVSSAKKAIELNPQSYEAYLLLGDAYNDIYFPKADLNKALSYYDKSLKLNPYNSVTYASKGILLARLKKYDEALLNLKKAIEINGEDEICLNNIAIIHYFNGNFCESVEYFKKALDISPNNINIKMNLALVCEVKGDKKEALELWKDIVTSDNQEYSEFASKRIEKLEKEISNSPPS